MILKDKELQNVKAANTIAGQKQELDVAFYLRREFKDHPQIFIINDYKFSFNNETAQIDHLIVYPYGFILIESKSITGEVTVNELGEWSRSSNAKWSGMPSPIKQAELQEKLLKEFLHHNRANILNKIADVMEANLMLLATAETIDNGKPIRETVNADMALAVDPVSYTHLRAHET